MSDARNAERARLLEDENDVLALLDWGKQNEDPLAQSIAYARLGPSDQNWEQITTWAEQLSTEALVGLDDALQAWPHEQRTAPELWALPVPQPVMRIARTLHLDGHRLGLETKKEGGKAARALSRSSQTGPLVSLSLRGFNLGDVGVRAIAGSRHLGSLTSLALRGNDIGPKGAHTIAQSAFMPALTILDLAHNRLGAEGARAIAESSYMCGLTDLDLEQNEIGDSGARAIAQSEHLGALSALHLGSNRIGAEGLQAIAESAQMCALRTLDLRYNKVGVEGVPVFAESGLLSALVNLDLSSNHLGVEGALALVRSTVLTRLTTLALGSNDIGPKGARALAKCAQLSALTHLDLDGNDIRNSGVRSLAASAQFSALVELRLSDNEIQDKGAVAIASSKHFPALECLDLSHNRIGDEGARALAASAHLRALTKLSLSSNQIGDEGFSAAATSAHGSALTHLDLAFNRIGEKGAQAIAESRYWCPLRDLNLTQNSIGANGARALAEAPGLNDLTHLTLIGCGIRDLGAVAIAESVQLTALTSLTLRGNDIGAPGARAIARSEALSTLTNLDLAANDIGTDGAVALAESEHLRRLDQLGLKGRNRKELGIEAARALANSKYLCRSIRRQWRQILGLRALHAKIKFKDEPSLRGWMKARVAVGAQRMTVQAVLKRVARLLSRDPLGLRHHQDGKTVLLHLSVKRTTIEQTLSTALLACLAAASEHGATGLAAAVDGEGQQWLEIRPNRASWYAMKGPGPNDRPSWELGRHLQFQCSVLNPQLLSLFQRPRREWPAFGALFLLDIRHQQPLDSWLSRRIRHRPWADSSEPRTVGELFDVIEAAGAARSVEPGRFTIGGVLIGDVTDALIRAQDPGFSARAVVWKYSHKKVPSVWIGRLEKSKLLTGSLCGQGADWWRLLGIADDLLRNPVTANQLVSMRDDLWKVKTVDSQRKLFKLQATRTAYPFAFFGAYPDDFEGRSLFYSVRLVEGASAPTQTLRKATQILKRQLRPLNLELEIEWRKQDLDIAVSMARDWYEGGSYDDDYDNYEEQREERLEAVAGIVSAFKKLHRTLPIAQVRLINSDADLCGCDWTDWSYENTAAI